MRYLCARLFAVCALVAAAPHALAQPPTGRCPEVTSIRFYPRPGHAKDMLHGRFSGSNDSETNRFEILAKIPFVPADSAWSEIWLEKPARFRFVKYDAPADGGGNVAEIELYSGTNKLTGTPFGAPPPRPGETSGFARALDGNPATFFGSTRARVRSAGLDFGASSQASPPTFSPPPGTYTGSVLVSLSSATPRARIRGVFEGADPSRDSGIAYVHAFTLHQSAVLAAIACTGDLAASPVTVAAYRIEPRGRDGVVRSFHLGNSLTEAVHRRLGAMASGAGRALDAHRFTIAGSPLEWLWENPGSGFGDTHYPEAFAAFAPIQHLILQPLAGKGRGVDSEARYGANFLDLCRRGSPRVTLWLYQTWPSTNFDDHWSRMGFDLGPDAAAWRGRVSPRPDERFSTDGFNGAACIRWRTPPASWQEGVARQGRCIEALRDELQRRFPGTPARIIPAGPALVALKTAIEAGRIPGLTDLFRDLFEDEIHLNAKGDYLVGLVHYACLFNESPERKVPPPDGELTPEQALLFQRIAWAAVRGHPHAGALAAGR